MDSDIHVRLAAFRWLEQQVQIHGDVLPWGLLLNGFSYQGQRVPLLSQQGIFKPAVLPELPLSIRTSTKGPYDDSFSADGLLLYRYQGEDPNHWQNRGLRRAMERGTPLIYFHGVVPGKYLTLWPVYVAADDPASLTFTILADDAASISTSIEPTDLGEDARARRVYVTATVRRRVHQRSFRERVLQAYKAQCAMCRLRHAELLDAAHIIPDKDELGEPRVPNGMALCKIHHAAFDQHILGVTPDYEIEVRRDILEEVDGPMLRYGIQGLQGERIVTPRREGLRPDRGLLEVRYGEFLRTG